MMGKMKYLIFFLLVTAGAYALSTLFLSYLNHELAKDLPLPASEKPSLEKKIIPPLSPAESPKPSERQTGSLDQKEGTPKRTPRAEEKLNLSSLNLKLLGTVVNESGSSWAIILDLATDRQEMVYVGGMVAGARVVSIGKDRVVLNIDGKEGILLLGTEGTRSVATRREQAPQDSDTSPYVLSREVMRENLENLPVLMSQARAEIYFREGKAEGFQLSQIQKNSILNSVGFKEGDVIQSVNGQGVRSLQDALALYQKFIESDSFTIGILRGNKPQTLHVKIK